MCTLSCRNKHIQAIQCLQATLGGTINTALTTGRGDINCLIRRNNIIRAYLRILYCHWVPTTAINYQFSITVDDYTSPPPSTLDMTTTEGSFNYSDAKPVWADVDAAYAAVLAAYSASTTIESEIVDGVLYIWSDVFLSFSNAANFTVVDLSDATDDYIATKNCLTNSQIEDIITSAYEILDSEYGCGSGCK